MSTPAQITASRENAKLSTGPRTEAGKQTASQNARRHGLTAKTLVLDIEDREAFEELRAALREDHRPQAGFEDALFETLVESQWRLNRLRCTETSFLNQCIKQLRDADPALDPDLALGLVFADPETARKMRLFLRYQSGIERAYRDALDKLNRAIHLRLERDAARRAAARLKAMKENPAASDSQFSLLDSRFSPGFVSQPAPIQPSEPPDRI